MVATKENSGADFLSRHRMETRVVQEGPEAFPGVPNFGRVYLQEDSTAAPLYVLVPRQPGGGEGCSSSSLGSSHLLVPTSASVDQGVAETEVGRVLSRVDLPDVPPL